ncbi:MAG: trehalose-phosphatase [Chloroflexi bacterium]|nr:trehalose-phosphatase [Chloroflexota bacterium]MDA1270540.1 trehalose-phosphatase [Chloroflexota bacterium]PKB58824.1 MAG: trehalose-phosphatase [SAR202 cluster bacterium Casp-Chloro-G2]
MLIDQEESAGKWTALLVGSVIAAAVGLAIAAELGADVAIAKSRLKEIGLDTAIWMGTHLVRSVLIVIVVIFITRVNFRVLPPLFRTSVSRGKTGIELDEALKRADSLAQFSLYAVNAVVILIATVMLLAEFGFNLAPLLAGVGIVGIALGFGAQHLVRDMIAGAFVLLEDHYRVGDVASVGGKTGMVEAVSLRRTVLRDLDGIVHMIPNGEITTASNYTKTFSRVNLNVSVAYKEDLDHVIRVLDRVCVDLSSAAYFSELVVEPLRVLRVDSFDDSGIAIKVTGVTKPIRQWEVTGELRRRIKREFDREGIEIPFPHRTIYWGNQPTAQTETAGASVDQPAPTLPDPGEDIILPADPWALEMETLIREAEEAEGGGVRVPAPLMENLGEIRKMLKRSPIALFTSIDGTLAPIALAPRFARISPAVRQALSVLANRITVVILTERDVASARSLVGLPSVIYEASHGLEVWEKGTTTFATDVPAASRDLRRLARAAKSALNGISGIVIEEKPFSVAVHYRQAIDRAGAREAVSSFFETSPYSAGLTRYEGSMVIEMQVSTEITKGTALRSIVEEHKIKSAIMLGDDITDVDGFKMLDLLRESEGLTGCNVAVMGRRRMAPPELLSSADYQLEDPEAVEVFLAWMAAEVGR